MIIMLIDEQTRVFVRGIDAYHQTYWGKYKI